MKIPKIKKRIKSNPYDMHMRTSFRLRFFKLEPAFDGIKRVVFDHHFFRYSFRQ